MTILVKLHRRGDTPYWVPVDSIPDACRAVRSFIESENIGASDWRGGDIRDGSKGLGVINYNGTVRP